MTTLKTDSMLFAAIQKTGIHLIPEEIEGLVFEKRVYKKDECLTRWGEVENYVYYLRSGSVKVSYIRDEDEYVLDFWFANDIISSYSSLISRQPSELELRAMTDTVVERIKYCQLQEFYAKSHKVSEMGRKMMEFMYMNKLAKQINLLTYNAEERYERLLQQSGKLVLELPVKDIAAYLGIKPESLSRIRGKFGSRSHTPIKGRFE